MRLFCVCVVLCVCSGLATGLSLVQEVCVKKLLRNWQKKPGPIEGCRAIGGRGIYWLHKLFIVELDENVFGRDELWSTCEEKVVAGSLFSCSRSNAAVNYTESDTVQSTGFTSIIFFIHIHKNNKTYKEKPDQVQKTNYIDWTCGQHPRIMV
jgi:hypothetical protein